MQTRIHRLLFAPIPIAPLAYLRIMFGVIMAWETWRYFTYEWIDRYYIQPDYWFTYLGFGWVRPLEGELMYAVFHLLGALSICIALGLAYRVVMPLFFLTFSYIFLLDQANYLNHFYMIVLVSFLMMFAPAHRAFSIDAWLMPRIRAATVPAWSLRLVQFQIAIVYFYGAVAKLNGDWLQGEPMRAWLANRTDFPIVGQFFTEPVATYIFSYGGIFVDFFALPMVLWHRTRWLGLAILISFHLVNDQMFSIGIFPWFMIAALPLYLPMEWWQRLMTRFSAYFAGNSAQNTAAPFTPPRWVMAFVAVYVALQVLIPLRHFVIPGDVNWTEEGHNLSWHMKLRSKSSEATFRVYDPQTDHTWLVNPRDFLSARQARKMSDVPDMIWLFSQYLAEMWRDEGYESVEVYATVSASLNGRPPQLLIDPEVNLVAQPRCCAPASWILPLTTPLYPQAR